MKIKKKSSGPLSKLVDDLVGTKKTTPGWMTRGTDKIKKNVEKNRSEQMASYAPTFWVADGETKQVRFLSTEPIAQIFEYSARVKGKYRTFTAPEPGEEDPFAEAGENPRMAIVYEIIDVTGYVDKQTRKRKKNIRRFWKLSSKLFENVTRIADKRGKNLTKFNIEVTRTGSGGSTTYTLIPEQDSPMPKPDTPQPLRDDFEKYFAPLPAARLRQIVSSLNNAQAAEVEDEDEDEDDE